MKNHQFKGDPVWGEILSRFCTIQRVTGEDVKEINKCVSHCKEAR